MRSFFLFIMLLVSVPLFASVRTGLDVVSGDASLLKGKKIALICNQTSVSSDGKFAADVLLKQKGCTLVALLTPEHGLNGTRKAGVESDKIEKYNGIPVYSLYGSTRKPTKKMLKGVTAVVFDLQDIGVRAYTYLSTMILAMEAAAEQKVEFIVLDRPNPLGGTRIEGNVLDTTLRSFVGQVPIPYIHGMTLGELAKMAKGERWFNAANKLKLSVITMQKWGRYTLWPETGLKWVAPSPNIPTFESAVGCAMCGAIGELGTLSVGVGSDLPFLRLGSRLVTSDRLLSEATISFNGFSLITESFTIPYADSLKTYNGVKIILPKDILNIPDLYSCQFKIFYSLLSDTAFKKAFDAVAFSSKRMFEKVTGCDDVLKLFTHVSIHSSGDEVTALINNWKPQVAAFRTKRKKYLLY